MAFDYGRIAAEEARAQLEAAGLLVEESIGTLYVRRAPNSMPDRLYDNGRGFSPREVKALVSAAHAAP